MFTSIRHIPEHKQGQLQNITATIVKGADPEKAILIDSNETGVEFSLKINSLFALLIS